MRNKILLSVLSLFFAGIAYSQNDYNANINPLYNKFRMGGYGEILFQNYDFGPDRKSYPDGAQPDNRSIIDIPRMILAVEYKFNSKYEFVTEIEFEHGGTGSALELEYEEMGEYEMEIEKAGEVVLEQFHITRMFNPLLKVRVGHMIIPVGLTNKNHLPTDFFGTVRPEGENQIIPLTWHETGIAILGQYKKWNYELLVVNGLDANGFNSENWVKKGKQSVFENTKITNPAFAGRINTKAVRLFDFGVSFYTGKSVQNTSKPEKMEGLNGRVTIGTFDFVYKLPNLRASGNLIYGNLSDALAISSINQGISKNIQYARTPVAKNAFTYSCEIGYNVLSFIKTKEKLYPFVRYEFYNSMYQTDEGMHADTRFNRQVITAGINYNMLPNLVLKADYSRRIIDNNNYNTENTIGLSLAYVGWFINK